MTLLIASTLPLRYRKQYVVEALRMGPARVEGIASAVGMSVAAIASIIEAMVAEREVWLVDGRYQLNSPLRPGSMPGEAPPLVKQTRSPSQPTRASASF